MFVQETQIVCFVFPILVLMNSLVLRVVQELVLVNEFEAKPFHVQLFVMEVPEPCNIRVEIKVRKSIILLSTPCMCNFWFIL